MRRQFRAEPPDFLLNRWQQWGENWEANLKDAAPTGWNWRQVGNVRVNHRLLPLLKAQAQDHCSFCDAFPVSPPSNETIEHFRPKSRFPRQAWEWENLFFCCDFCQTQKGERWEEALLKPDEPDYAFERYFMSDYTNGELLVRPDLSPTETERAHCTIEIYALNDPRHCVERLRQQEWRSLLPDHDIDSFAYRDFLQSNEG